MEDPSRGPHAPRSRQPRRLDSSNPTRQAIDRYHHAKRWAEVARSLDSGPHSNPWSYLATDQASDAERDLIHNLYCHGPVEHETQIDRCEYKRWSARGVQLDGRIYLAVPNPDSDETESDTWIAQPSSWSRPTASPISTRARSRTDPHRARRVASPFPHPRESKEDRTMVAATTTEPWPSGRPLPTGRPMGR